MVVTNRSAAGSGGPASQADGGSLTAPEAAARIGRLFPEVYRRYHYAQRLYHGADLPVTRRGLEVLRHLASAGPLTVGEQAAHLGLRRNSASELLQRLEAKGLVTRIRDERDERRVLVWLTASGREVVARIGEVLAPDLLGEAMAGMSPEDRATVIRGFELLVSHEPGRPAEIPSAKATAERTHR